MTACKSSASRGKLDTLRWLSPEKKSNQGFTRSSHGIEIYISGQSKRIVEQLHYERNKSWLCKLFTVGIESDNPVIEAQSDSYQWESDRISQSKNLAANGEKLSSRSGSNRNVYQ